MPWAMHLAVFVIISNLVFLLLVPASLSAVVSQPPPPRENIESSPICDIFRINNDVRIFRSDQMKLNKPYIVSTTFPR